MDDAAHRLAERVVDELVPSDRAQSLELRRDDERAEVDAVFGRHADLCPWQRALDPLADFRRRHGGILKAAGTAVYDAGTLLIPLRKR
jgi:hypothetical protein